MCEITVDQISGELPYFSADFSDCNGSGGGVHLELIAETSQNGVYSINGNATDSSTINDEILVPNSQRINPTKVFNYIAKKLKEVLCPSCT